MNNSNIMDCSSRIKLERQKRSWTQEQLAERAKLSTRTVQRIECGAEASLETVRLIAEAMGVSVESLRAGKTRAHFSAPWSRGVKVITAVVVGIVLIMTVLPSVMPGVEFPAPVVSIMVFLVIGCLLLGVNGYTVRDGRLLVHRLGWATKFDLSGLSGLEINPHAMMGSIRLFGNGGIFCFVGWYRASVIGRYRAYVTDPAKSVVLEFGNRKIVVSPDDPEAFVDALRETSRGVCKD